MRLDPQPITLTGQVVSLDIATHRFIGCTRYANIFSILDSEWPAVKASLEAALGME